MTTEEREDLGEKEREVRATFQLGGKEDLGAYFAFIHELLRREGETTVYDVRDSEQQGSAELDAN